MIVVFSFQVLRTFLVHTLKTKHENIYIMLGRPAPIGRDVFFVFDINGENGYRSLSRKERWLVRFMQILACIGAFTIVAFICLLAK
jgi:hypothetical protein